MKKKMLSRTAVVGAVAAAGFASVLGGAATASAATGPDLVVSVETLCVGTLHDLNSVQVTVTNVGDATATGAVLHTIDGTLVAQTASVSDLAPGASQTIEVSKTGLRGGFLATAVWPGNGDANPFNNGWIGQTGNPCGITNPVIPFG